MKYLLFIITLKIYFDLNERKKQSKNHQSHEDVLTRVGDKTLLRCHIKRISRTPFSMSYLPDIKVDQFNYKDQSFYPQQNLQTYFVRHSYNLRK